MRKIPSERRHGFGGPDRLLAGFERSDCRGRGVDDVQGPPTAGIPGSSLLRKDPRKEDEMDGRPVDRGSEEVGVD